MLASDMRRTGRAGLRAARTVLLTGVASCYGNSLAPDILENSPTHHTRITGTVLLNGQPRADILIFPNSPMFHEVFADYDSTDANGHFELYLQRAVAPKANPTMVIHVYALARPPVTPERTIDSVAVQVTFVPLRSPASVTTLAAPLELP